MVLSEPEGLLRIAIADLETAEASSDPARTNGLRRETAHRLLPRLLETLQ